jgi:hypothetical protein
MNSILSAIRKPGQLTCAWVPTGNAKMPLVCVWNQASSTLAGGTEQSSSEDEEGGISLCA